MRRSVCAASLLFFMSIEYTLYMVPSRVPPFDLGFVSTESLHRLLESKPALNTRLAGLNTVVLQVRKFYYVDKAIPILPFNIEDDARSEEEIEKAKKAGEKLVSRLLVKLYLM